MVEWKKLGSLLDYEQPTAYLVKSTEYNDSFDVPVLTAGQSLLLGFTNELKGIYRADKENPTIIFDDFTTSFHWVDYDFKVKSSAMKMLRPIGGINFRYIYYAMLGINYFPTGHQRHWISKYSQFEIPIPSLSEQTRIVGILDTFTASIDNLKEQIAERRKQYEHYRDQLLDLEGKEGVEMVAMKDLFVIRNGYTPSKNHPEYWESGTLPWFRMEDIRQNGRILSDSIQHITPLGVKKGGLFPANSIIVATTATIGEHALLIVDSLANQQFTFLTKCKSYDSKLNMKYMYYYMFIVDEWCKNNINVSGFASVDMDRFKKLQIPIPALAEQQRIVSILDTFEASITNLEAQLREREKQYEYYRNKLLTFE